MLLKDLYSPVFYDRISDVLEKTVPGFDRKKFTRLIFDGNWEQKELKDRMRHTTQVLHRFFPAGFPEAACLIEETIRQLRKNGFPNGGLEFMFLPDYVETYGLDDYYTSVPLLEFITQFITCEFAVRPFLLRYGQPMIHQMEQWSLHENHHVRRLSTEGIRPRLPWAMALPFLKKDPSPVLPILENLKTDSSEYVRRSVANNLNDIAKDHPAVVVKIARQWKGISKDTDAIIRHGSRTLLKQGHPDILAYFGLGNHQYITIEQFRLGASKVQQGGDLHFSFSLHYKGKTPQPIRLEYGMYYLRQNGSYARKVFKISEKRYEPGEKAEVTRKQSFRPITTRVYYPGKQQVSLIVNGKEVEKHDFLLI